MKPAQKPKMVNSEWLTGAFSKAEAARLISKGAQHVISIPDGQSSDPGMSDFTDEDELLSNRLPWERTQGTRETQLVSSDTRHKVIENIMEDIRCPQNSQGERVRLVLEELCSNAIFHAYQYPSGKVKYDRDSPASLNGQENVMIQYSSNRQGIYLSVGDNGIGLPFENIQSALERCYNRNENQIEEKIGGAGLGIYMIYENVTHLKIASTTGRGTTVSVWIAKPFDPKFFSFHFFQENT